MQIDEFVSRPFLGSDFVNYLKSDQVLYCMMISIFFYVVTHLRIRIPGSVTIVLRIILILSSIVVVSSILLLKHSKTHLFYSVLGYEIIVRSVLELYAIQAPNYHMGSIDGSFVWAALLQTEPHLDAFFTPKYLQMTAILISLVSYMAIEHPWIEIICRQLPKAAHYYRRVHLIYHLVLGDAPWLLWVPDAIVLSTVIFLDLYTQQKPKESKLKITSPRPKKTTSDDEWSDEEKTEKIEKTIKKSPKWHYSPRLTPRLHGIKEGSSPRIYPLEEQVSSFNLDDPAGSLKRRRKTPSQSSISLLHQDSASQLQIKLKRKRPVVYYLGAMQQRVDQIRRRFTMRPVTTLFIRPVSNLLGITKKNVECVICTENLRDLAMTNNPNGSAVQSVHKKCKRQ
ncbi:hypothetical protein EDD86DRAFT_245903 [Gorgonomyces haynaldii]|nr:hypothetical protein EDD86DRAFT_245903 [Gorgonomyces haynaldii]